MRRKLSVSELAFCSRLLDDITPLYQCIVVVHSGSECTTDSYVLNNILNLFCRSYYFSVAGASRCINAFLSKANQKTV